MNKRAERVHLRQPVPLPLMHCLHLAQPGLGGFAAIRVRLAHGLN